VGLFYRTVTTPASPLMAQDSTASHTGQQWMTVYTCCSLNHLLLLH